MTTRLSTDITKCPVGQVASVGMVFEIAVFAERQTAEFYGQLARAFSHFGPAHALWTDLAADELEHAEELALLFTELNPDAVATRPAWPLVETARELRRLVADIPAYETLDDAFQITHERENSALTTMYALLGQTFIPEEARRLAYDSRLKVHIQKLARFSREYGGPRQRKRIRAILP